MTLLGYCWQLCASVHYVIANVPHVMQLLSIDTFCSAGEPDCNATIRHDNSNHSTTNTQCKSWRSPSCLGGSSHGWVPVENHSTPGVAHQQHTSVTTQRAQMTTRGGHCPNMVAEQVSDPRNSTRSPRSPSNKTSATVSQQCRRPPVPRRVRRIGPSRTGMSTKRSSCSTRMRSR